MAAVETARQQRPRQKTCGRATVMDAEMLGIAMGWNRANKVATYSQGAIGRIQELRYSRPSTWVEELVVMAQEGGDKEIVWVKGHSGIPENDYADFKSKEAAAIGSLTHERQTATTAGNRQEFCVNRMSKPVTHWNRKAFKDPDIHSQRQRSNEGMGTPNRESGGRQLCMRSTSEYGTYSPTQGSKGWEGQVTGGSRERRRIVRGSARDVDKRYCRLALEGLHSHLCILQR